MDGAELARTESSTGMMDVKMQTPSSLSTTTRTGVPRIDTEPMYTALKAAIGEGWAEYKSTMTSFLLGNLHAPALFSMFVLTNVPSIYTGKLNQAELSQTLHTLLSPAPSVSYNTTLVSTIHLHNILLFAIYSNIHRDPPPEAIAAWVLATDAPASALANKSATQGGSDKADERLKREVMALSARDRRRIKSPKDNNTPPSAPLRENAAYTTALTVPITSSQIPDAIPSTATSLSKTNWDLEIRRRYVIPLASETLDFPSRADIQARIEPICYEEGVGLSAVPMTTATLNTIAELVETATETYVKEYLSSLFSTTRSNAPGELGPITAKFRAQMRKEEDAVDKGELARSAAGFLPCEQEALTRREPLTLDEVRLHLRLAETRFRHDPFLAEEILDHVEMDGGMVDTPLGTNGHGYHHHGHFDLEDHHAANGKEAFDDGDAIMHDSDDGGDNEEELGWEGATLADRDQLFGVLDQIINPMMVSS
jgi:transcriptional coactivator HFI1/ADA1